jgi:hypothetical protein
MRVLAVVGTKGPFPRLVAALVEVARDTGWRVRVQHATGPLPAGLEGWPQLPREALLGELEAADAVVCHGGSGAIRDALALGHRPIVVPRLGRHGEHVDDHQLDLARALGDRVALIEGDLAGTPLADALRRAIGEAPCRAIGEAPCRAIGEATRRRAEPLPGEALRRALALEVAELASHRPSCRSRVAYGLLGPLASTLARSDSA